MVALYIRKMIGDKKKAIIGTQKAKIMADAKSALVSILSVSPLLGGGTFISIVESPWDW